MDFVIHVLSKNETKIFKNRKQRIGISGII